MSISGLENTFKKNDAPDIIAPTFTWNDIRDKPKDTDLLIRIMQDLVIHARHAKRLKKEDTLRTVKKLMNEVLINVLNETQTPIENPADLASAAGVPNAQTFDEIIAAIPGITETSTPQDVIDALANTALIPVGNETDDNGDIRYIEVDWAEIENKPTGIDIFSRLIDNLRKKAAETPLLDRGSSLGQAKDVINEVLLDTLSATEIGE